MPTFDPRIVPKPRLDLVRAIQERVSCRFAGGAVLSGLHLRHRLSRDIDLFFAESSALRDVVRMLPDIARRCSMTIDVVRDAGGHVRAVASGADPFEIDLVYEPGKPIEAPEETSEHVVVDSWIDLRAAKVACLIERSEPRDLVDILFLERAGHPPEADLAAAAKKDAGIDPATLAWLLRAFPVSPLPSMLSPLSVEDLRAYRDTLAERFRKLATTL